MSMEGRVMEETKFINVNEIQRRYLPVSKKVIRKMLVENLNVIRNGNRILVDREQFLDFLDKAKAEGSKT